MTVLQGILLGLLQGIAEFLPISSSGHLAVVQEIFGLDEVPLLFDVMLHLATLFAVCIFFRKKIGRLLWIFGRWITRKGESDFLDSEDLISGSEKLGRMTITAIIFTTLVTGVIGIFTSKLIPSLPVKVTCAGFIITAGLLYFSSMIEKKKSKISEMDEGNERPDGKNPAVTNGISVKQALFIGLMQGIGTLPGISRSGSTIAGAQLAGVNRSAAGEYSFIVSIPAILGAFILEAKDLGEIQSAVGIAPLVAGCVTSFVSGYFSLAFLMKLIKKGRLEWFALYLIPAGIFGILFL